MGVDNFGPVEVRKGSGMEPYLSIWKLQLFWRWIPVSTLCGVLSRRGQVTHLVSDNGTSFVGADRELNHQQIKGVLAQIGICWSFNTPTDSHHNGVWERMISIIRRVLSSVLCQQMLDDHGLHKVFCEAEVILNDQPLTKQSDDPNDLEPLTPNHLLLLKGKPALPPGVFEPHDVHVRKRWRQVQYLSDLFSKRWVWEYLPLLQEKQKWNEVAIATTVSTCETAMDNCAVLE